ncbi:AraC family transcriptional regulator [Streptomyces griseocarneus]|nr:AraC family transcriptional regulator [Streptomyces griseocarneus]
MSAGTVAVVVTEEIGLPSWDLYELSIPCTVFGKPQPDLADPWYEMWLCGTGGSAGETAVGAAGLAVRTPYGLDDLVRADTVVVPSVPDPCVEEGEPLPGALVEALREAHAAGARMVSLCTGAFALAEAGLLDGRRATAHWMHTAQLAARYPKVRVDDSVLYVDDGDVLTSAGLTAGLDLCLHLVRRDLGAHVANQLARRMVVPAHRPGGQAQFIELPVPEERDAGLAPVLDWARAHLDRPLTVQDLARRAAMSPRTFYRRLQAATGTTPLQWLLTQRLGRARALLESTDLPVERIGELSGLGTANNLRHHFLGQVGVTPSDYRRAFPRSAPPV